MPIGMGVGEYTNQGDERYNVYGLIVYWKGALFFDALRQRLGDDVFFDFLKAYFKTYEYGFASAKDFQTTAESTCGCQLQDLFNLWVYDGGPMPVP
jgi:aminopeptidase N